MRYRVTKAETHEEKVRRRSAESNGLKEAWPLLSESTYLQHPHALHRVYVLGSSGV